MVDVRHLTLGPPIPWSESLLGSDDSSDSDTDDSSDSDTDDSSREDVLNMRMNILFTSKISNKPQNYIQR